MTDQAEAASRLMHAQQLLADADMRIEVVKREVNQGALAGHGSEITDYAAALIIAALDNYDTHREQRARAAERRRLAGKVRELDERYPGCGYDIEATVIESVDRGGEQQ